ncbi:MAG: hypothetical protein Q9191_000286 [Dirinaria sp. TL-2023a]
MSKWKRDSVQKKQFSLQDEAQQTGRHSSSRFDSKLRFNRINFVSAGTICGEDLTGTRQDHDTESKTTITGESTEPDSEFIPQRQMANLAVTDNQQPSKMGSISERNHGKLQSSANNNGLSTSSQGEDSINFFVDVQRSREPLQTGFSTPLEEPLSSPTDSTSSDEVILFAGRENLHNAKRCDLENHISSGPRPNALVLSDPIKTDDINARPIAREDFGFLSDDLPTAIKAPQAPSAHNPNKQTKQAIEVPSYRSSKNFQILESTRAQRNSERNAAYADYVAHIAHDPDMEGTSENVRLSARQLDTLETSGWEIEREGFEAGSQASSSTSDSDAWDAADLQDFDELSTSNEVLGNVQKVISKRDRASGLQYLVVFEGHTTDEARWLHHAALADVHAQQMIRGFEVKQLKSRHEWDGDDSEVSDEESQIAKAAEEETDGALDDQDLLDRPRERMTDEQLARLLSKQEELGIGSERLVLFDAHETSSKRVDWNAIAGSRGNQESERYHRRKEAKKRSQGSFVDAGLLADVLDQDPENAFELLNMEPPSLKKKPKGRRGRMPLDVSDSELEQSLQAAWENDRNKKKKRKIEREQLRAQGLLGKKGRVNMKAKYAHGIAMSQVKEEIKEFLLSTNDTLSLPPMGKRERYLVHEIASTFGLKSKSRGDGDNRFPTLVRTKRTRSYDERLFKPHLAKVLGVYKSHRDRRDAAPLSIARGGGFSKSAVSYRDGDIVGASAPELGLENRGRNILEKMGWSTGTALGTSNNKGIMQPVPHVVKVSKAGLG